MENVQTTLKNRLALLSAIQDSDWFRNLERSKLLIDTEGTIDGEDPNKAPAPGTPLKPNEERSWDLVDTQVVKPDTNKSKLTITKKRNYG